MAKSVLWSACVLLATFLVPVCLPAQGHQAVFQLPAPGGCHAVGIRSLVLRDASRKRDLIVTLWYPSVPGSRKATYLNERAAAAVAADWKLRPDFTHFIHTNSSPEAAMERAGVFPLVLLEHGSGVVPENYTILAEELASHGFIVAATNHPPDSLIAVYPDGHEVTSKPYWPVEADRRTQGVAIGKFADHVLVVDVRFVLDSIQDLNVHDRFWGGHIDMSKVGIVGHSMGGTTAALATKEDPRILAGVNLDGSTFPGMNEDIRPIELHKPLLFLATEEHASGEGRAREYSGSDSETYYVVVPGTDHMSFTDKRLIQSHFSLESQSGSKSSESALLAIETTRFLVEQFLAKYLQAKPAPGLDLVVRVDKK